MSSRLACCLSDVPLAIIPRRENTHEATCAVGTDYGGAGAGGLRPAAASYSAGLSGQAGSINTAPPLRAADPHVSALGHLSPDRHADFDALHRGTGADHRADAEQRDHGRPGALSGLS